MHFRLDRNVTVLIATGMVCFTMLLFGTLIWPTPYTYEQYLNRPVRINRFTGNASILHYPGNSEYTNKPYVKPTFDY